MSLKSVGIPTSKASHRNMLVLWEEDGFRRSDFSFMCVLELALELEILATINQHISPPELMFRDQNDNNIKMEFNLLSPSGYMIFKISLRLA